MRNVFPAEQIFHFPHLELALGIARITAVGLAFVTDRRQPVRVDSQAKQLVLMGAQHRRQLQALHIVFGQRVVGRTDAELHGHVQAGRGLAAARHADQDQVGLVVVVGAGAVVVVQGEVDRLDPLHVVGVMANGMGLAHGV